MWEIHYVWSCFQQVFKVFHAPVYLRLISDQVWLTIFNHITCYSMVLSREWCNDLPWPWIIILLLLLHILITSGLPSNKWAQADPQLGMTTPQPWVVGDPGIQYPPPRLPGCCFQMLGKMYGSSRLLPQHGLRLAISAYTYWYLHVYSTYIWVLLKS